MKNTKLNKPIVAKFAGLLKNTFCGLKNKINCAYIESELKRNEKAREPLQVLKDVDLQRKIIFEYNLIQDKKSELNNKGRKKVERAVAFMVANNLIKLKA